MPPRSRPDDRRSPSPAAPDSGPAPARPARARRRRAALAGVAGLVALAACRGATDPPSDRGERGALFALGSTPEIGATVRLNADTANCRTSNLRIGYRTGRVVAVSQRAIVVADEENPAGGFTAADYQGFAAAFDTLVYPVDTRHFGVPTDLDNNGRVVIFFTSAVNALTPPNAGFVVGGFFFNRDLFPLTDTRDAQACAGSNDGEMFYMLVPDPNGTVNGNRRQVESLRSSTLGVLAHEFQHLISAGRRLYGLRTDNYDEEVWLNEGLSHVAEELTFFQAAGLSPAGQPGQSPRADLTATRVRAEPTGVGALNAYQFQNLQRFSRYLAVPERSSPYAQNDSLSTRGAAWSLLRYVADRSGRPDSALTYALVNSRETGVANLRTALTAAGGGLTGAEEWLRAWAVANYADNFSGGLPAQAGYPSWNFRDALTQFTLQGGARFNDGVFPLRVRVLDAGPAAVTLGAGGVAYFPFSVPAGGSATVRVTTAGGGAPPSTLRAAVVALGAGGGAVTPADGAAAANIPVTNAGGAAAPYVLVTVNADLTSVANPLSRPVALTVSATGVGAPLANRAGPAGAPVAIAAPAEPVITDAPLLTQLRAGSARTLAPLVGAARARFAEGGRHMMAPRGRW